LPVRCLGVRFRGSMRAVVLREGSMSAKEEANEQLKSVHAHVLPSYRVPKVEGFKGGIKYATVYSFSPGSFAGIVLTAFQRHRCNMFDFFPYLCIVLCGIPGARACSI
jgi:hypothetical protein